MVKTTRALPLALFAGILLLIAYSMFNTGGKMESPMLGRKLPNFMIPKLDGNGKVMLSGNWEGNAVLINIFASWCEPCRNEHPVLLKIASDRRIGVYGIAWRDTAAHISKYLNELGNPYQEVGIDERTTLTTPLGLSGIPETMLVDKDGIVRWKFPGPLTADIYERELMPLIEKYVDKPVSEPPAEVTAFPYQPSAGEQPAPEEERDATPAAP